MLALFKIHNLVVKYTNAMFYAIITSPTVFVCTVTALIGADNVAFLCELLDEIGRKDLTDKVKTYVERMEGTHAPHSKG